MANIVYNYDKSSCNCYLQNNSKIEGYQAEIPLNNKPTIGPECKSGIVYLNNLDNFAKDFHKIKNSDQYYSSDPRLISSVRGGQVMLLDAPPTTSEIPLNTIVDDISLNNYGQNYKKISDINAGNITYYFDRARQEPFNCHNFTGSAKTTTIVYTDPMGGIKPEYKRVPLKPNVHIGPERDNYEGCLSWIQDSTNHREDMMSLQMSRANREKYTAIMPV